MQVKVKPETIKITMEIEMSVAGWHRLLDQIKKTSARSGGVVHDFRTRIEHMLKKTEEGWKDE